MSRGRHSSQAWHQRAQTAEADVTIIKRAFHKEEREHEATKRIAAQVEPLQARCRELEMQLDLATCAEIKTLTETLTRERAATTDALLFLLLAFPHDAELSVSTWVELRKLIGHQLFEVFMSKVYPDASRESRRAWEFNSDGFNRALLNGDIDRQLKSQRDSQVRSASRK